MLITSKSTVVSSCECCGVTDQRHTYKIERVHYCRTCAERKLFKKSTATTRNLVSQFDNDIDYKEKLELAKNIIQNGEGSRKRRVRAAKIQTNISLDIRNLGHGRYVILSPAGKIVFEAPNDINDKEGLPQVDPDRPFQSICEHVKDALNNGMPTRQVAEFIWNIRGEHDNITAMMYDHHVVVTWPHGQKTISHD